MRKDFSVVFLFASILNAQFGELPPIKFDLINGERIKFEDLANKASQQVCRDLALRGVEEMFEALQHLKNWKPHKLTEEKEFNKEMKELGYL